MASVIDMVDWWTLSDTPENAYLQFKDNRCRRTLDAACEAFKHLAGPLRKFRVRALITIEDEGEFVKDEDYVTRRCGECGRDAHTDVLDSGAQDSNLARLKQLNDEGWVFDIASGKLYCQECYAKRPKA